MRPFSIKTLSPATLLRPHPIPSITRNITRTITSTNSQEPTITPLKPADFPEWSRLFTGYLEFYKTSIPSEQYPKTFARLLDPENELYGLVLRENESKLLGIAHYFPHMTPWGEGKIMLFNDLFVDPAVRGGGYGRKLIQAVAADSKKKGCFRMQWTTQNGNPARKLYDELATQEFVQYRMAL
ncbi:hypothetical protein M409DRAFT_51236 [Zasmidium cellare ATCC 36951]|uniref:N-acetyltransferase domain-containing protein n=1 Tax=Zasmidium cellare ATCC 36951 TaxID=1080233 RepID=A0A6A6CV66_ZASCE|nr:uncharacterized protein M409DRAFT_51236 [Zasmidium cellare ATCC 36951]KAF2171001.1 hypothetical protein M409DRAFT_51236 [Zasmidium cellare ATCC 36951]